MGKIIKFDPNRRRKKDKPSWTRPEDYGVSPPPARQTPARKRKPAPAPRIEPAGGSPRAALLAKLAVAAIIVLALLVSLYGLD